MLAQVTVEISVILFLRYTASNEDFTTNSQNVCRQSRSTMPAPGWMSSKQIGHVNGSVFRTRGRSWTFSICCKFSCRWVSSSRWASCQHRQATRRI